MPQLPDTAWFECVPDWVCEVLSPATANNDRNEKLQLYARLGVSYAWLVDPEAKRLDAYQNHQGRWRTLGTHGGKDRAAIPPFDAIEWELSVLWAN